MISEHPEAFKAEVLTADRNAALLARQAVRFRPAAVVIADESRYRELRGALKGEPVKVYAGKEALREAAALDGVDTALVALVGFAGLLPTISAIKARKRVALANKETLVAGGELVSRLASENNVPIIPVDSEHSAIFQCVAGESCNPVARILLTSSGGPFLRLAKEELRGVTVSQALRHPRWSMGAKITVDSATMMNKGFEVIEASWLFGVSPGRIQVLVHPQSVVHSAVQFADGVVKAQLGAPDMRIPIQYALSCPARLPSGIPPIDLAEIGALTFEAPDEDRFPCLPLAYEAMRRGGNIPCAVNAANEVANLAFRENRIRFTDISRIIAETAGRIPRRPADTLECLTDTDREARAIAGELVKAL